MVPRLDPTQAWSGPGEPLSLAESGQAEQRENKGMQHCEERGKFSEGQDSKEELKEGLQCKEEFAHREKIHRDVITEQRSEASAGPGSW